MSKEMKVNLWWCFFIAVISVIYAVIYSALPLAHPVMWCTYISCPIYFLYQGTLKDIPGLACNIILGFTWGSVCLLIMEHASFFGTTQAQILGVFIAVFVACALHMGVGLNTFLGRCPLVFASFACCFANEGGNILAVCGTLIFGLFLGEIFNQSKKWAEKLA